MQNKEGIKALVKGILDKQLPNFYYYHNTAHTLYVLEKAIEIGKAENCTNEEIKLLYAASLFHDIGFVKIYDGHEEAGCVLAKKYLPEFGYSPEDFDKVCGMIMATKIPQSPHNKLEEIIADADLEYLGTDHVVEKANHLFQELEVIKPGLTRDQWDRLQISFLRQHHYFTQYCKEKKEPAKQEYLYGLEKRVK
ncbi:MAG: HD domain-containing protein [Bacteroidetes bacterium]|nr:HD domain-containing protein [Bacteroidota bacterium]